MNEHAFSTLRQSSSSHNKPSQIRQYVSKNHFHQMAHRRYLRSGPCFLLNWIPEQFDCVEGGEGRDAARRRELEEQFDDAEEVDVGVVDGEVDGDHPRALVDPEPLAQLLYDGQRLVLHRGHVLVVSPGRVPGGAAAAQFTR